MQLEQITKYVGGITAVLAMLTGGYTAWEKVGGGFRDKRILAWAPEHFHISSGAAQGEFRVVVARKKLRDDCSVEDFRLEVRDSELTVHPAQPSMSRFSGPAGPNIDKFAFTFTIQDPSAVAKGTATLLAHIIYKCPEGEITVNYPQHDRLNFTIE
jgi:hypothetical protein